MSLRPTNEEIAAAEARVRARDSWDFFDGMTLADEIWEAFHDTKCSACGHFAPHHEPVGGKRQCQVHLGQGQRCDCTIFAPVPISLHDAVLIEAVRRWSLEDQVTWNEFDEVQYRALHARLGKLLERCDENRAAAAAKDQARLSELLIRAAAKVDQR